MALTPLDILNGSLSLITIGIASIVGISIISKYFEIKNSSYLIVGLEAFMITEPWWPASTSFLVALFNNGQGIEPETYFIIGNVGIPLAVSLWLLAFCNLTNIKNRKSILLFSIIYGIIFEIVFFTLLYINPAFIGELNGPIDVEYRSFVMVYLFSVVGIILITGIIFAKESLKTDNPEIRLRGKLILIAFICFCIGAFLDTGIHLTEVTLIIARLILMFAAFAWWAGFIMPEWMKRMFFKEKKQ